MSLSKTLVKRYSDPGIRHQLKDYKSVGHMKQIADLI